MPIWLLSIVVEVIWSAKGRGVNIRRLKTSEAAALLNVSPNTLRAWERRFGFPDPARSPGRHRIYAPGELAALRDALQDGLSISSAVSRAREWLAVDADSLVAALMAYEPDRANVAIQAALALRSVERTVIEVLLPSLDQIRGRKGPESAAWAFAARWGADWLREATRLASPPVHPAVIVLGDASRDELDPDAPYLRALELLCVRASVKVLSLSVRGVKGIADAMSVHRPTVVVVAGSHVDDETVARWAYAIRQAVGRVPLAVYRRGAPQARNTTLPAKAREATQRLLELIAKPTTTACETSHLAAYRHLPEPRLEPPACSNSRAQTAAAL